MNELTMLREDQSKKILQTIINEKTTAIMSYSSKGKWHVAKVTVIEENEGRLCVECVRSNQKQHPVNIQVEQPVGISFKHKFGKFVFDSTVVSFKQSAAVCDGMGSGGTIVLTTPENIKVVERRSYYRVEVPESLKVKVLMWHRSTKQDANKEEIMRDCCQGRMLDISAGGVQLEVKYKNETSCQNIGESQSEWENAEKPNFKKGQFVSFRFTPMPYETPMTLSAQIRNVLPIEDSDGLSICLQIVGLEASPEGHLVLSRLINIVGKYYQMNQSGAKHSQKARVPSLV